MTPFVLLIGLGTHSTFEGIAVGMCTDMSQTVLFVVAIVLHKGAAGMALGISFAKTFPGRDNFILGLLALFGIFTPLGVIIGWIITANTEQDPIYEIIFGCLAAGTFLYIACSEVIVEEFSMPDHKPLKLFFFLIGMAMISMLYFLDPG